CSATVYVVPQKNRPKGISQKKRAVSTRPFGREARIVPRKALICNGFGGPLPGRGYSEIRPRSTLICERKFFASSRRFFDPKVGLVARRGLGGTATLSTSSWSR